jgi:hypothetical protein
MYNTYDMLGTPIGAGDDYDGGITIHTDLGRRFPSTDLTVYDAQRLQRDLEYVDLSVDGWYVKLAQTDATPIGKGGGADGTGEGEAGEGEGTGEGTGEEEADGDADGDQEEEGTGDGADDKKEEEMPKEFESPDMGDQESAEKESLQDDRLLQEIWERFAPLIAGRVDILANCMADYVI